MGDFHSPTVLLRYYSEQAKQAFEGFFERDFSIRAFDSDDSALHYLDSAEASPAAVVVTGCPSSVAVHSHLLLAAKQQHSRLLKVLITERIALNELMALLDTQMIDRCFDQPLDPNLIRSHLIAAALTGAELSRQAQPPLAASGPPEPRPAVLIVDDEPAATKYLIRQLEHLQDEFTLLCADSAEDALEYLRTPDLPVAVVMTDQRMPGMQGKELLDELRQSHPAVVRILTSAWGEVDVALNAVNEGRIFRYQKKPWQAQTLLLLFREAIARHRQLASALNHTRSETRKRFAELRLQRRERLLDQLQSDLDTLVPFRILNAFLDTLAGIEHVPAAKAHLRASQDTQLESELVRQFGEQVQQQVGRISQGQAPVPITTFLDGSHPEQPATHHQTGTAAERLGQALNTLLRTSGLDWNHLEITETRLQRNITTPAPLRIFSHLLAPLTRLSTPLLEQQVALLMVFVTTSLLGGDVTTSVQGQSLRLNIILPAPPGPGA
ncbi:response regulator [Marinobacter sp. VGCF2001]